MILFSPGDGISGDGGESSYFHRGSKAPFGFSNRNLCAHGLTSFLEGPSANSGHTWGESLTTGLAKGFLFLFFFLIPIEFLPPDIIELVEERFRDEMVWRQNETWKCLLAACGVLWTQMDVRLCAVTLLTPTSPAFFLFFPCFFFSGGLVC